MGFEMENFIDNILLKAFTYGYKIKTITLGYDIFNCLMNEAHLKCNYPLNSDPKSKFIYYKEIKIIPDLTNKTFVKIEQE